jgi:L-fuconolactonase
VIIDAHHHVWDPAAARPDWLAGFPALDRRFDLPDFAEASAGCEVGASVLVQVLASAAETESFLSLAAGSGGLVAGVVGWADLTSPAISDELARLRSRPGGSLLVGIRHLVQDEPDPDWLRRPDVYRGLRAVGAAGLPYDLLVRPAQLPAAIEVAAELDDAAFVLDHGAKPPIAAGRPEPWSALVGELARMPNVACKLSGLVTEAGPDWTPARIAPYADRLLACFGPERLMFGSDWPVCTLAATYTEVVGLAHELLGPHLSRAEQYAVFAGNATRHYGLRQRS